MQGRPTLMDAMPEPTTGPIVIVHESVPDESRPDELDVLVQAGEVGIALAARGWNVRTIPVGLDLAGLTAEIRASGAHCVFNLVESLGGDGRLIAWVPELLEASGLPFTGCSASALYLSSNKRVAKQWLRGHGVPTPDWVEAEGEVTRDGVWIVKSAWEHASLGLDDDSVVRGGRALALRIERMRERHGGEWFAERYVDGREFNVSLLGPADRPRVLPIAEIHFENFPAGKPRIVGYAAKWHGDSMEYTGTPRVFPDLATPLRERIEALVLHCWSVFALSGYARVDLRMDDAGQLWVLEVNANPCLSRDAGFVAAAAEAGLEQADVIDAVVAAAGTERACYYAST